MSLVVSCPGSFAFTSSLTSSLVNTLAWQSSRSAEAFAF
uniref:Uncharacterized protein n=1 Tax=Utricularia reniformis TaxID=192314 RepID=A0A1Y0B3M9_9LAMI|nr:hypothetical protein AEK19_MT1822 [Utricularia reniformis]ART31993.1 hypothetical protein AEK19_MT1822 [Utricularia reniformis]